LIFGIMQIEQLKTNMCFAWLDIESFVYL
jgi:hypothetical protein